MLLNRSPLHVFPAYDLRAGGVRIDLAAGTVTKSNPADETLSVTASRSQSDGEDIAAELYITRDQIRMISFQ